MEIILQKFRNTLILQTHSKTPINLLHAYQDIIAPQILEEFTLWRALGLNHLAGMSEVRG